MYFSSLEAKCAFGVLNNIPVRNRSGNARSFFTKWCSWGRQTGFKPCMHRLWNISFVPVPIPSFFSYYTTPFHNLDIAFLHFQVCILFMSWILVRLNSDSHCLTMPRFLPKEVWPYRQHTARNVFMLPHPSHTYMESHFEGYHVEFQNGLGGFGKHISRMS